MKQVTQSLDNGVVRVVEVPKPALNAHSVLVRTSHSLISAGTERSKIELGRANLIEKARRRPRDVQAVLAKVRREGLLDTYRMVKTRLGQDDPLGYSAAGVVERVGDLVAGFRPGDRVACGGAGYANHAEYISVPGNLCAHVPDGLGLDAAAYATTGAIAMQGFRQAEVGVGDWVGVIGLGLLGQLTVAIAQAAGCRVCAIDLDDRKVELAARLGAELALPAGSGQLDMALPAMTGGLGLDAVIITAATSSSAPIIQAGELARDRGVVVVVGDVAMNVPRSPYYEKELTVRLSRSYGPGRYDASYEEFGIDYPEGYVKWTERRNMEEFLRLASAGAVDFAALTTHRFSIDDAAGAYEAVLDQSNLVVGALLEYPGGSDVFPAIELAAPKPRAPKTQGSITIGLVGAGNFATATLLPAAIGTGRVDLGGVATAGGLSAGDVASRFGFAYAAEGPEELLADDGIDALVIVTRHDTHADLVSRALAAGKHVFVEKPLAVTASELRQVVSAWESAGAASVLVGFNRRYAPHTRAILDALKGVSAPRHIVIRVNAGALPDAHWIKQAESGGGRIVGELCHFIDLACCFAGTEPRWVYATALEDGKSPAMSESVSVNMAFVGGSVAAITYTAVGDSAAGKESVEVHCGGSSWIIDDFVELKSVSAGRVTRVSGRQDKGHRAEMAAFVGQIVGEVEGPNFQESVVSTASTLAVIESLASGLRVAPRLAE